MGRHSVAEEPPPPKDKPRYRFVVALGGILGLALLAMAVVNAVFPEQGPQAAAGPDPIVGGLPPDLPGNPPVTVTSEPPVTSDPSATVQPTTPTPPTPPSSTAPTGNASTRPPAGAPSGQVTGSYSVDGTPWPDGFIGSVQLDNENDRPESWQVVLVFPSSVGELQNRWISGGPGSSTVTRSGQTVVFNSTEPLAAGSSIGLYFQFMKAGTVTDPDECWVNGRPCS